MPFHRSYTAEQKVEWALANLMVGSRLQAIAGVNIYDQDDFNQTVPLFKDGDIIAMREPDPPIGIDYFLQKNSDEAKPDKTINFREFT